MVKVWLQRTSQFCVSELYMCVPNDSYSVLYLSGNRKDTGKEEKYYVDQGWGKVLSVTIVSLCSDTNNNVSNSYFPLIRLFWPEAKTSMMSSYSSWTKSGILIVNWKVLTSNLLKDKNHSPICPHSFIFYFVFFLV